jgi:hypothetical protein
VAQDGYSSAELGPTAAGCACSPPGSAAHSPLRFAILASGYLPAAPEVRQLLGSCAPIDVPSLHIFGDGSADLQVPPAASMELRDVFTIAGRRVLRHAGGHLLPATKSAAAAWLDFLAPFAVASVHGQAPCPV